MNSMYALQQPLDFYGSSFDPALDGERLTGQLLRVFELMRDERWRTLGEIRAIAGGSEAGISARLRDCRKARFGGHSVQRKRRTQGTWEYRLVVNRHPRKTVAGGSA